MFRLLFTAFFALIVASCGPTPGQNIFNQAKTLESEGESIKAIVAYREALSKDPRNHDYLNALTALENHYLNQSRTFIETAPVPLSPETLEKTEQKIASLKKLFAERPELRNIEMLFKQKKAESVDVFIRTTENALTEGKLKEAEASLALLQQIAPNRTEAERLQSNIQERKLFRASEEIKKEIDAEEYTGAHEKLELLKQQAGLKNPIVQELQDLLLFRDSYFNYFQRGNILFKQERYEEAQVEYQKALRYNPTDKDALAKLETISRTLADDYYFKGKEAVIRKQGMRAMVNLVKAAEVSSKIKEDKSYQKVWQRLEALLNSYRKEAISRKEWAIVYAIDQFIIQYYPEKADDPSIKQEQAAFKRTQQDAVPLRFGILPFSDSEIQEQHRAKLFTDLLFSRMHPLQEQSFDMISPDQILALFPPDGQEGKGLFNSASFNILKKEARLELLLSGKILFADVKTIDTGNTELKKVPIITNGKSEVKLIEIKSGTVQARANLSLFYTLYDLKTGKQIASDALDISEQQEDSYSDGFEEGGIQPDPLDIPSESAMMMIVMKKGADKLKNILSKTLKSPADFYLKRGERAFRKKGYNEAMRDYLRALWSKPTEEQKKSIQNAIHTTLARIFLPSR